MFSVLKRIIRNTGLIASANVWVALVGIASLSITARTLGAEQLGALALIQAYVGMIDKLFNFQSWQALIRYGAAAIAESDTGEFERFMKFGFFLDGISAVGGTVLAAVFAGIVGSALEWSDDMVGLAMIFSMTVLFHIEGTPVAVLRLFDRFDLIAFRRIVGSILVLAGVILATAMGGALSTFVIVLGIAAILGHLLLLAFSLGELSRRGYRNLVSCSIRGLSARHPELWRFVWTTNLTSSLRLATTELDVLLVGSVTGHAATGLYKIIKQATQGMSQVLTSFSQTTYPDMAAMWARGRSKDLAALTKGISITLGCVGLIGWALSILFGEGVLRILFGAPFVDAYPTFTWYLLGAAIFLGSAVLSPVLLTLGKPQLLLKNHLVASSLYLILLYVMTGWVGLVGAGISYAIYQSVWAMLMGWTVRRSFAGSW